MGNLPVVQCGRPEARKPPAKLNNKVYLNLKETMQATVTTPMQEHAASLLKKPSTARASLPSEMVRQPGASLTLLVCHVHPSQRWENAVWFALGLASLVQVVMSFGF